jgi:hypothetical protein
LLVALGIALAAPALAGAAIPGVAGRVVRGIEPVPNAAVYAYQVVERTYRKVATDRAGEFQFDQLPAGLYKIVAHKIGTPPAVLVLARRTAEEAQYVQVELARDPRDADAAGDSDYWAARAEIPSDVLRDLQPGAISLVSHEESGSGFRGGVAARAGFEDVGAEMLAQVSGAQFDVDGQLGALRLAVAGEFENLAAAHGASAAEAVSGQAAGFRVDLSGGQAGKLGITGQQHRRLTGAESTLDPLDYSNLQLRYVNDFGDAERSTDVSAQYLDENGLHAGTGLAPRSLPLASRLLSIQGSYAQLIGERASIRAGMRYRASERLTPMVPATAQLDSFLDLWSRGEIEASSAVVLEYGLFTTLRDGSVSLLPRGGFVLHLTPRWQASLSASQRFLATEEDPLAGDFTPMLFRGVLACEDADSACYEAQVVHGDGEDDSIRVRSSWREFDRTVRLFLRDDFYAGSEGIFFVPGDSLPEFQATIRRRLGEVVVASWSSSYAAGGGGVYRAANNRWYQNEVVYLSASLDTTIEPTATGVFVAFQRVDQSLDPIRRGARRRAVATDAGLERYELGLSQDLSTLFDLATSWAVRVGMEVERGETLLEPVADADAYRRRLTTSVAVRF